MGALDPDLSAVLAETPILRDATALAGLQAVDHRHHLGMVLGRHARATGRRHIFLDREAEQPLDRGRGEQTPAVGRPQRDGVGEIVGEQAIKRLAVLEPGQGVLRLLDGLLARGQQAKQVALGDRQVDVLTRQQPGDRDRDGDRDHRSRHRREAVDIAQQGDIEKVVRQDRSDGYGSRQGESPQELDAYHVEDCRADPGGKLEHEGLAAAIRWSRAASSIHLARDASPRRHQAWPG
jgi:hypothetical protein